jgi:hypothetical protein
VATAVERRHVVAKNVGGVQTYQPSLMCQLY